MAHKGWRLTTLSFPRWPEMITTRSATPRRVTPMFAANPDDTALEMPGTGRGKAQRLAHSQMNIFQIELYHKQKTPPKKISVFWVAAIEQNITFVKRHIVRNQKQKN